MLALDTEGLHPSTLLCLAALEDVHDTLTPARVLDMGCGNGILSTVAARIWPCEVVAADISPRAIEDASLSAQAHDLKNPIQFVRSDGFSDPVITQKGPYQLIFSNLLADLLLKMASDLRKSLDSNGLLIASGILVWRAEDVKQAYINLGFDIYREYHNSPWVAYIFRHKSETSDFPLVTKA